MMKGEELQSLSRRRIRLSFGSRTGFRIFFDEQALVLAPSAIAKVTCKFVDALILSLYFARAELEELRMLSRELEREMLKRTPQTQMLIKNINLWFSRSALRQSQLREWMKSAPQLFLMDIARAHLAQARVALRSKETD